jgi:hypothetical protein
MINSKQKVVFAFVALLGVILASVVAVRWNESTDQPSVESLGVEPLDSLPEVPGPSSASTKSLGSSRQSSTDCPNPKSESEQSRDLSQFLEQHGATIARRLADSADPEHLLVASYIVRFQDSAHSRKLLNRARAASPGNALIARNDIAFCLQYPDAQGCGTTDIDQRGLSADGQNGTLLLAIAARRAKRGDLPGALEALNKAATAPLFDSYYSNQVLATDRALSAASDLLPSERLTVAFGIVPLALEEAGFELCRKQLDSSNEWRHVCLSVASRMEEDGDTLVVQLLGAALQARIHRYNGDSQQADAADGRRAALRDSMAETAELLDEQILRDNPQLINRYLGSLTSYGELEASEFIRNGYSRYEKAVSPDHCRQ